ncbi:S8 family serine peptidase [Hymenobacter metallilatus]|uniref:T9SS C-terminal target domain-containing protein n=1 Tax=Hymenobacter metallilatus TaxID=2493666 RepID=A0A3R9MLS2_9BACT|nr:S8 family serine peptidase [Hymenobacter metallilatus]RSK25200.1 T9SS C-terminal target domain-containing protein [Hymenobacter metallilatus]
MVLSRFLLAAGLSVPAFVALAAGPGPQLPAGTPAKTAGTVRKHLVYFKDKAGTPYTVSQPQAFLSARAIQRRQRQNIAVLPRDLPVSPAYVQQVKAVAGAQLWYTSRWFNAAIVACDSATLQQVQALPCVRSAQTLNRGVAGTRKPKGDDADEPLALERGTRSQYGKAFTQAQMLGAVQMHDAGFRGEGMQIAVFDAGFPGVNTASQFAGIFQDQRLASTFNVVEKTTQVFQRDSHGTHCLSTIGGNQSGLYIGTAPKATFRLFITEDIFSEHPVEEANWLIAAEKADSAGVDIISSSLGYSTFDYPSVDYTYANMNGRTALSTRAATVAARVGMVVVSSAGNEGNNNWRYITAPADADSILTVGATDSLSVVAGFSSRGPTADGRIKPNLAAMGVQTAIVTPSGVVARGNGTSYSCPVLAGMVAGFWQANPTLTAQQVIGFLQRSGTRALTPNDDIGYGIPNFVRAYNLANPGAPLAAAPPAPRQDLLIYPNPSKDDELYLQLAVDFQSTPLQVRIFDARGALVAEQRIAPTSAAAVRLQPGVLTKGVYTCRVSNGREQRTVRFVKL